MSQALNSELVRQVDQFSQSILSTTRQNEAFVSEALSRLLDDMSSAFQTKFTLLNTATSESEKSIQHAISEIQAQHTELLRSHYLAYESFLEKEMAASSAQITDIMGYVSGEFTRDFQQLIEQMQTVNHELKSQVAENHEAN
jgi:gas vesicle protein